MRSIVWFRGKDLRLGDHAPLAAALEAGEPLPLFLREPGALGPDRPRAHQLLLEGLADLARGLERRGSGLLLAEGKAEACLPRLAAAWGAGQVLAQRRSEPGEGAKEARVARALARDGVAFRLFEGESLLHPRELCGASGGAYTVFTPFAKAFHARVEVGRPLAAPTELPPLPAGLEGDGSHPTLGTLGIAPCPALLEGGEAAAEARLARFLDLGLAHYAQARDRLDLPGTSRLSQDLHFGFLSARQVWRAVSGSCDEGARAFQNELLWREFAHEVLRERPWVLARPFRESFEGFPWRQDPEAWEAWEAWAEGRTGYPLVDAAARQLLAEGFVHNRARMVAASFLCKHLMLDYRLGEAHYLRLLGDGDEACNSLGWQWSAGCGVDAQPWFRIFNPEAQGRRFDPDGDYVRRWVPELAALPARWIHRPESAPLELRRRLDYPVPMVAHPAARQRFLDAARAHLRARPASVTTRPWP